MGCAAAADDSSAVKTTASQAPARAPGPAKPHRKATGKKDAGELVGPIGAVSGGGDVKGDGKPGSAAIIIMEALTVRPRRLRCSLPNPSPMATERL